MTAIAQQKQASTLLLIVLIIFLVLSLSTLTVFLKKDVIEADLTQRSNRLIQVSGLLQGSAHFEGQDAVVEGTVSSEKNKQKLLDLLSEVDGVRSIQANLSIKASEAKPTQASSTQELQKPEVLKGRFTLRHDAGRWILVGEVESEATKSDLMTSTTEVIGHTIVNLLSVAENKPRPPWVDKYLRVLEKFSYVHGGAELTLNKGILTVGGEVDSEAAMRMTLLPFSEEFGDGASIRNTLRIPKFVGNLYQPSKRHPIEKIDLSALSWNTEQTEVQDTEKLDEIIAVLKQNPDIDIEIAGHSNQSDDEDINTDISLKQALLIKKYLLTQEIKKSRLRTNGYGSLRPVSHDTAQNQRIEITVLKE
jgi:outer membrane protein OmpA-like peptidoglycan-associated protein